MYIFLELCDTDVDEDKQEVFIQILSKIETIKTSGESLPFFLPLCTDKNAISELYLDFAHKEYTSNLADFLGAYHGSNLKVLEIKNMDFPIDLKKISRNCQNLESLRMMLDGSWVQTVYQAIY